jgi:hypothetical protein
MALGDRLAVGTPKGASAAAGTSSARWPCFDSRPFADIVVGRWSYEVRRVGLGLRPKWGFLIVGDGAI